MNIIKNAKFRAGRNCGKRTEKVQYIVIHYTGSEGTAQNNISYFNAANRNASAHYFVGRDGVVCEYCDPKTYYAWHCGGSLESSHHPYHGKCTNRNSIGIEICTHYNGKNWEFTDKAVTAAVELTKDLMKQFNVPVDRVIRHYDVTGKACPRVPGWGPVGGSDQWNKFKLRLAGTKKEMLDDEIFVYYPCWARKTSPDDRRGSGVVFIDQDCNCVVYDAYDKDSVPSGKLIKYMIKHGVTHYTAVGSHGHSDHLGGFFEMLKKAGLKMDRFVCYNPASLTLAGAGSANARSVKDDKAYLQSLINKAKAAGADIRYVGTGDTLTVGSMHFTFWRKQPAAFGSQDTGKAWGYMNHGSLAIYCEETKTLFSADGPRAGAEMLEYFKDKEIKVVDSPHHGNGAGKTYAEALGKRGVLLAIETNNEKNGPGSCSFTSFGSKRIIEAGVPVWMLNGSVYGHAKSGRMTWKQTGKAVISYPVDLGKAAKVPYTVNVTTAIPILKTPAGTKVKDCPKGIYTIIEEHNGYGRLKSGAGWIQLSKTTK